MDGASIYAGASSGSSGVAANLLACLLARAFTPSEATAIWVELVAQRKREIEENSDASQFQSLAARMACRQDLSRNELAKWDASARAWLLSADEVKKLEATQFKLIVKDLGMFTSSVGDTYASIIDVWTTAMRSLQDLINGMPQKITKGALLLGISAWHIYPDLNVVGPTAYVKFKDHLINPGGIITIGLSASGNDTGAKWSLSLSHLRYYGDPVTVSMPGEVDSSRITMQQLLLVALGCVIGSWGMYGSTAQNGAELLIALKDCLGGEDVIMMAADLLWLNPLWTAAKAFLDFPQGTQRDEASHLIAYGRRNGQSFLEEEEQTREPIFGLANPLILPAMSTNFPEDAEDGDEDDVETEEEEEDDEEKCIEDLRRLASRCRLSYDQCVIQYRRKASQSSGYIYATAIPLSRKSQKRDRGGSKQAALFHMCWVQIESWKSHRVPFGEECHRYDPADVDTSASVTSFEFDVTRKEPFIRWHNAPRIFLKHSRQVAVVGKLREKSNNNRAANISLGDSSSSENEVRNVVDFQMIACNAKNVALFKIAGVDIKTSCFLKDVEVIQVLRSGKIKTQKLRQFLSLEKKSLQDWPLSYLERCLDDVEKSFTYSGIKMSLLALARAKTLYDELPGATVSMAVTKRPLYLAGWAMNVQTRRASRFACIAMFETGTLDIGPDAISSVMAMSSGNSIYVTNGLIQDPLDGLHRTHGITRILGNLGRPGVVMLVPPPAPRIVARDSSNWRLINHRPFNGEIIDSFQDTSLHLSFTEYEVSLSVSVGAIDADAVMLESLISVYDREKWIADLDVLGSLANPKFVVFRPSACHHEQMHGSESRVLHRTDRTCLRDDIPQQLVSIDSWDELLDPPERLGTQSGVIRAHNNWQARLATLSVCVQMEYRTMIVSKGQVCEYCARSMSGGAIGPTQMIIS